MTTAGEDSEPRAGEGEGRSRRESGREVVEAKEVLSERQGDRQQSRWPREGGAQAGAWGTPGVASSAGTNQFPQLHRARKQV